MPTGDIQITIADGGSNIVVPAQNVQAIIGCSSIGTVATPLATRSIPTLLSTFGAGPLVEAAALVIRAGGTVIATKASSTTTGSASAVIAGSSNTSTSIITVTGTPVDTYYVVVKVVSLVTATILAGGAQIQISLDGGRQFSPSIALPAATPSYTIPGPGTIASSGVVLSFAAGTLAPGDTFSFGTIEPLWNAAGVVACLTALLGSPYAQAGWGSSQLVGKCAGTDVTTIQGALDASATSYLFLRLIAHTRDASPAVKWGGTAETEATWLGSSGAGIALDYSVVNAKRSCVNAGHYNMPTALPILGTAFRYRRPLSFALGARAVQIPPQRHAGRVRDGSLGNVAIDPVNDPSDGFVYHDERITPALDAARFSTARTRIGVPGLFITNPNLMSNPGSDFSILPLGNVIDVACSIVHQVGQNVINSDVRANLNGTLYENDARGIETSLSSALASGMTAQQMISAAVVVVDRTTNVLTTKAVNVTVTVTSRGYILQENVTIGFANTNAA